MGGGPLPAGRSVGRGWRPRPISSQRS